MLQQNLVGKLYQHVMFYMCNGGRPGRYWCSYGFEDYRDSESGLGDVSNFKPATGKGSRPDKTGAPCHGILDQDAVGTRAMYAPRILEELRQKCKNMGTKASKACFLLPREPFLLGIQTDWQLQQMLRYGHNGSIASHSTFGSKKLKYPLSMLLVFDSSQNAISVAWVITFSLVGQDIHKWIGSLAERIWTKDPRWRLNTFLVDDPSFGISVIRDESFSTNAWYQALHIPNVDVILDEQNLQLAKVISQTDRNLAYIIWNPGSEFAFCDCHWSSQGNLCKHVIKVAIICKNWQVARPLLAAQIYRQTLLSLLHNPPDDPVVLDHPISSATRLQQDIKGLEDLSNSGLLQQLPPGINSQIEDNSVFFARSD
ncbi:hypothetical protein REPUB_Repub18cG0060300 [Reevesia pubescens]